MVVTTQRKKIEILIDRPLMKRLRQITKQVELTGYTLFAAIGGEGGQGRWRDDQVTGGAGSKVLFVSILNEEKALEFLTAVEPLLDEYGLLVTISDVEVIRAERF